MSHINPGSQAEQKGLTIYFPYRRLSQDQTLLSFPWHYGPGFFPVFLSVILGVPRNQAACRYCTTGLLSHVTPSMSFTTVTTTEVLTITGSSATEARVGPQGHVSMLEIVLELLQTGSTGFTQLLPMENEPKSFVTIWHRKHHILSP